MAYKTRSKRKQLGKVSKTRKKRFLRTRSSREHKLIEKLTADLAVQDNYVKGLLGQLWDAGEGLVRVREYLVRTVHERNTARSMFTAIDKEKGELFLEMTEVIEAHRNTAEALEKELLAKKQKIAELEWQIIKLNALIVGFLLDKQKQS